MRPDGVTAAAALNGAVLGIRVRHAWAAAATLVVIEGAIQVVCRLKPGVIRDCPSPLAKSALDVAVGMGGYFASRRAAAALEDGA